MSEAPRWGSGGLRSNRLDEFSMTSTADALNRPEFHRGSWGPRSIVTGVPPEELEHPWELQVEEQEGHGQSFSRSRPRRKYR
jgi:hypothetical protein